MERHHMQSTKPTSSQHRDGTRIDHPAFAIVSASRITGGSTTLFGSPVRVGSYVELSISRAHADVRYMREGYRADDGIATVRMSETQWAALISRMNVGEGVPATLSVGPAKDARYERYPEIEAETDAERRAAAIDQTLKENLALVMDTVAKIKDIADVKGTIPKTELKEALRKLESALGNAPKNFKYAADEITRHMDKVVTTAKTELNAHAMALGFESGGMLAIDDRTE